MVHWSWIIISLFIGVVIGVFVIALAAVSREDAGKKKWWEE